MIQILDTLADQRILYRLGSPLARDLQPGHWLQSATGIYPVFRHDAAQQWIDLVAEKNLTSETIIWQLSGMPLQIPMDYERLFLLCQGDGLFRALHLLQTLPSAQRQRCIVLAESAQPWPFRPAPSRFLTPQLPAHVTAGIPLLEDWKVLSRLCHRDDLPGCYGGGIEELLFALQEPADRSLRLSPPYQAKP